MELTFDFEKVLARKKDITFAREVNLNEAIKQREPTYQALKPFNVTALLHPVQNRYVTVKLEITGNLIVPSTRSLKPAEVAVSQSVTEVFMLESEEPEPEEEAETPLVTYVVNNQIDLYNMVVDYILLAVPPQVLTAAEQKENAMPQGDDWQVISESDFQQIKQDSKKLPNQEFNKLAALKNHLDEENNE